jgi:predicted aspartyl protease
MGIYGFLSAAYQETAALAGNIDAQIALIVTKRDNIKEQIIVYNEEKTSINESITGLRNGLSNNVIQYTDTLGNVITTQSSSTRKALTSQLDQTIERQTVVNTKLDELNSQLFDYETEIVEVSNSSNISGELGPLKYLAGLTGTPMDKIINWLLITIIFVFDPLAIALVVAANFAFAQLNKSPKQELLKITRKIKNKEEKKTLKNNKKEKKPLITKKEIQKDLNEGVDNKKSIIEKKPIDNLAWKSQNKKEKPAPDGGSIRYW